MTRLEFRSPSVGFFGDMFGAEWPEWIRKLRGKSGIYIIRGKENRRILYVGESHSGNLKKTILRHFQSWTGRTAGPTYPRAAVEIAVRVTMASRAVLVQNKEICRLHPRDNTSSPGCKLPEDNPF